MLKHSLLKYIYLSIITIVAAISITSCSEDDGNTDTDQSSSSTIQIAPYILKNNNTRMTGSSFQDNDQIGVFAVADVNNDGTNSINNSYAYNVKNIYDGFEWEVAPGESLPWYKGTTKVSLYAYYPYQNITDRNEINALPFTVNTDQSQLTDFGSSDFLWAKTQPMSPTKNKVGLSFTHSLSKIRVNLKARNGLLPEALEESIVHIINTCNQATIDLSTGVATVVNNTNKNSIKTIQLSTPDSGYDATFEAIVIPQNIDQNADLLSIQSSPTATPTNLQIQSSVTLEPQKQYTLNYYIDKTGISVISEEIQEWNSGGEYTGVINKPKYQALDLSTIDWDKSRVHTIYYNGTIVGQVTKEYLYKIGDIDRQAIVVYPMASNGKVDLTKGFVAQVMQANINSNLGYSVDATNSIHGGSVSFNNTSGIASYTPGTDPVVTKVRIEKTNISIAQSSDILSLTTQPKYITDFDNNNYPVVKIGIQYWMGENLKTEHYRDGTKANVYYYDDDTYYKNIFGGLYDWEAVSNAAGILPEGSHIATFSEYDILDTYLGSSSKGAGRKLKTPLYWADPTEANNITGFTALPGGYWSDHYRSIYYVAVWWASTQHWPDKKDAIYLDSTEKIYVVHYDESYRIAVRGLLD